MRRCWPVTRADRRIEAAFAVLREQVRAYRPEALIVIGDDQGDMFDEVNNPTFAIYTGDEPTWGRSARDPYGVPHRSARSSSSASTATSPAISCAG